MSFFESYKRLDNLCKDLLRSDKGVTSYIEEMEKYSLPKLGVPEWKDDYYKLKHYRYIRNQIAHEPDFKEEDNCSETDDRWVEQFIEKILNGTDPLTSYKRSIVKNRTQKSKKKLGGRKKESSSNIYVLAGFLIGCAILLFILFVYLIWPK